ncbi:MAG: hypothetical protein II784_05715, partial [Oscillospiraceae bacterium]|nr:hypothetical protein [Oscillospiraceae bacterium]
WADIAMLAWCLGMAVMLVYAVVTCVRLRRELLGAEKVDKNVYASVNVDSPFIFGIIRPRIYIPAGLEGETRELALRHEAYHMKRLDHIAKPLAYLLLTLHWFNPLCWLSFFLMSRDMEMSCDEKVLSELGGSRKEYSSALLALGEEKRFPKPSPLNFGGSDIKTRIKNILRWSRPKAVITVIALVICLAALAACAMNPNPAKVELAPAEEGVSAEAESPAPSSLANETAAPSSGGGETQSSQSAARPQDTSSEKAVSEQPPQGETHDEEANAENAASVAEVVEPVETQTTEEVPNTSAPTEASETTVPVETSEPSEPIAHVEPAVPAVPDEPAEPAAPASPAAYVTAEPFAVYEGSFDSYEAAIEDIQSEHIDEVTGGTHPGWYISQIWDGPGVHLLIVYASGAPHRVCSVFIVTDEGNVYAMPIREDVGEFTRATPTDGVTFSPDGSAISWSLEFDSYDGNNMDPPRAYHYAGTYTYTADMNSLTFYTAFQPLV